MTLSNFRAVFFLLLAGFSTPALLMAGHNSGLNVSYECLGGNEYEITVNLFRDCSDPEPTAAQLSIYIYSQCALIGPQAFPLVSTEEVSQLCPSALLQSNCIGGTEPGIELNVYRKTVTLPPCADWTIVAAEQNRTPVANLVSPETNRIHVEAFLNNEDGACNTSPALGVLNLPYVCAASPVFYNLGFTEPDGDSLVYELVPALTSTTPFPNEMDYPPPYSGNEPIPGISINAQNGQISVTPANTGLFTAAVRVSEYRDGTLIGQVTHDFLFIVTACPVPVPAPVAGSLSRLSGGGYPLDDNTIGACEGDDFCFEIAFSSEDPALTVDISSNIDNIIPGAVMTVTGGNPATAEFCGTIPDGYTGGSFLITATDDKCPVVGQSFFAVDMELRDPVAAGNDTLVCAGEPVNLFAENGGTHTWTLEGDLLTPGADFSCNPCDNPVISTDSTVVLTATGAYPEGSCQNFDEVTVFISLTSTVDIVPESCNGNDGSVSIDVIYGSGNYTAEWADDGSTEFSRTGLSAGTYEVTLNDLDLGCTGIFSVVIPATEFPDANAGPDASICGLTQIGEAILGSGTGTWTFPGGISASDVNDPQTQITAADYGTYTLTWTEDAGNGCVDTDEVTFTYIPQPAISLPAADTACGSSITIELEGTADLIEWELPAGISINNPGGGIYELTAAGEGNYSVMAIGTNGGICIDTAETALTFYDIPVVTASPDQSLCELIANVNAETTTGNLTWTFPPGIAPVIQGPDNEAEVAADATGEYTLTATATNGICTASDELVLLFPGIPQIQNPTFTCTGTDALFEVSFQAVDGDPASYDAQGIGGSFDGATFTSFPQPSETEVEIVLTDEVDCGSDTLTGTRFCPVLTFAGEVAGDTLRGCGSTAAEAVFTTPVVLDGNDTLLFALHTESGEALGTVLEWSADPVFSFNPSLAYETVYYISPVVGNMAADGVDLSDPFLSVAAGTPVIFYESPEVSLTGDLAACPYDTVFFAPDITGALPQSLTYSIDGDSFTETISDFNFQIEAAVAGEYTLTSVSSEWCPGSAEGSAELAHYALPSATATIDDFICEGDTASLSLAFEGEPVFTFDLLQDGTFFGAFSANIAALDVELQAQAVYTVAGLTDARCTAGDSIDVFLEVRPLPVADAGADTTLCHGALTPFGSASAPGTIYTWEPTPELTSVSGTPVNFLPGNLGDEPTSTVLYLNAELNGCTADDSVNVTVYPIPEANLFGLEPFCAKDSINLFGTGAVTTLWSPVAAFSNSAAAITRFSAESNTEIMLLVINEGGCRDSVIHTAEVFDLPAAAFSVSDTEGCAPLEVECEMIDGQENTQYVWETEGRTFSGEIPFLNYTFNTEGNYPVFVTATSPEGCSDTSSFPIGIAVYETYADFRFEPDEPTTSEPRTAFFNQSPLDDLSIWQVDSMVVGEQRNLVYVFPDVEGDNYEVCLNVLSPEGCTARRCETVTVADDFFLYIPNAFTPDADGLNDLFGPVLSTYPVEYKFWIANRRGQIVFETDNPNERWNGGGSSGEYYEDTEIYIWQITARPDFDIDPKTYRGSVILLR